MAKNRVSMSKHVTSAADTASQPPSLSKDLLEGECYPLYSCRSENGFSPDSCACSSPQATEYQWRLCNGLWALFIGFGTVICALKVQSARSWRFYNRALRGFFADYGVTLSVFVWSGLSYALQGGPQGVPRRLALPNTWDVRSTWTVANVRSSHFPSFSLKRLCCFLTST